MTKLLLTFSLLLLTLASAQAQPAAPPLNVMSWNSRYDNAGDGVNAWRHRKDWMAEIILREKVEVAGFQEVLARQFDDLQKRLPDHESYGVGRDDGKQAGEMVPIFYRRERFKELDKGTFWLSPTPDKPGSKGWDAAITRIVSWLLLEDKESATKFYVLNAHFDHRGVEARKQSAALIVKRIREEFKAHPVIFLGDLNSRPDTAAYETLAAKGEGERALLQDAYVHTAAKAQGPDSTWNGFTKIVPGQRIDYVFTTAQLAVKQFRTLDDQREGKFPSDHLPIVAEVLQTRK
jgi:endonuclease/exonuclease/phosphatase family metal-dependent hydrolase